MRDRHGAAPDPVTLLEHVRAGIVVASADGTLAYVNRHAGRLLGAAPPGVALEALVDGADRPSVRAFLAAVDGGADGDGVHAEFRTRDGERVLEFSASALPGDPPEGRVVLTLVDVTGHHRRASELERQATTDALTGLANRMLFADCAHQAVHPERGGALAVMDLDRFKDVNDRYGHDEGDALLLELTRRMRSVFPPESGVTVGRIGGDEFAILFPERPPEEVVGAVCDLLVAIAEPHRGRRHSASAGLAVLPTSTEAGSRSAAVARAFREADTAMYRAKGAGRDRVLIHIGDDAFTDEPEDALRAQVRRLNREARTDPLTGAGNRRRFDEDLARLAGGDATWSVVFIDLDHFGLVNKAWNETVGDRTLRAAAATLRSVLRRGNRLYRYGGEEFAALLPGARGGDATWVCRRLRMALHQRDLPHPTLARVTASFGVACSEDHPGGPDAVVTAAITAMRDAKRAGRDRVVTAPPQAGGARR